MSRFTVLILAAVFAVACACNKSDDRETPEPASSEKPIPEDTASGDGEVTPDQPEETGTPEGDPAAEGDEEAAGDAPATADEEIPTVEDFEDEAAEAITEASLEKELEALESEIGD